MHYFCFSFVDFGGAEVVLGAPGTRTDNNNIFSVFFVDYDDGRADDVECHDKSLFRAGNKRCC